MAGAPGRSGGPRVGTPGRQYKNRADLRTTQAVKAAPGQTYGTAGQQSAAQNVIPLPQAPGPPSAAPAAQEIPQTVPLSAPTQRPDEPVTAGLPFGAGPGPEANMPIAGPDTGFGGAPADNVAWLRALQAADPTNTDIADLIAHLSVPGGT